MHRSAWKFLYGILPDRWSFSGDTIFVLVNMRDNNFFATKNIGVRHENLADNNFTRAARIPRQNSGRPWMIDARTLHYSHCKLFIYHSIYTIIQRTPTILLHRTNCTQQRNATYRLYSFGNIISFHHICVCLCYWQYSISIMYCLGQSFVSPNRHRVLAFSRVIINQTLP